MGIKEQHREFGINAIILAAAKEKRPLGDNDIESIKGLMTKEMREAFSKLVIGALRKLPDGRTPDAVFITAGSETLADMFYVGLVKKVTFKKDMPVKIDLSEAGRKVCDNLARDGSNTAASD